TIGPANVSQAEAPTVREAMPQPEKTIAPSEHSDSISERSSAHAAPAERPSSSGDIVTGNEGSRASRPTERIEPIDLSQSHSSSEPAVAENSAGAHESPQVRRLTPEEQTAWQESVNNDHTNMQREFAEAQARGEDPVEARMQELKYKFLPKEVEVPAGRRSQ